MVSGTLIAGSAMANISCRKEVTEEFLQKHFLEMNEEEKKQTIKRLEDKYLRSYGKKFEK